MTRIRMAAAAAAAALAMGSQAAWADDFTTCDGYAAPTKKTDGMTEGTWMFGLATATVDLRPADLRLSERGIEACDRALADPLLQPDQWLRRANLQQAKALHAIQAGKFDLALEAADQSDETGKADPFFVVSLGLGNQALRALALSGLGRKDEALAALEKVRAARPWSASIQRMTTLLQFRIDEAVASATFRQNIVLAPENANLLYWDAIMRTDYAAAIAYAPAITWDLPKKRGGWVMDGEVRQRLESIKERAEVTGALAFALTLEGRKQEAALVLQEANEDLAEAMALPPQRPNGKPPRSATWRTGRHASPMPKRESASSICGRKRPLSSKACPAARQKSPSKPSARARSPTCRSSRRC